ncbi:MAG: signal peptidase II [Patescibacteria group bacterium]|jgi:lipoprotein signal peptidase
MARQGIGVSAGVLLGFFVLDRVSRYVAFTHPPTTLVPGVLRSVPTQNAGIAFGIPVPSPLLWVGIAFLVGLVSWFGYQAYRRHDQVSAVAAATVVLAAFSNVLDRLQFGYVRDFLALSFWPTVGNLADWLLTVAACVLLFRVLRPARPPG